MQCSVSKMDKWRIRKSKTFPLSCIPSMMAHHILKPTSSTSEAKKTPQQQLVPSSGTLKMEVVQHVLEPRDVDVLLGRGKSNLHHPGNKYFQQLIRSNRDRYFHTSSTNDSKRVIIEEIVHILHGSGRLCLKQVGNSNNNMHWVQLSGEATRQKIAHALQYRQRCTSAQVNKVGEGTRGCNRKKTDDASKPIRRTKKTPQQAGASSNEGLEKDEKGSEQPQKEYCSSADQNVVGTVSRTNLDDGAADLLLLSECEFSDQWIQSCMDGSIDDDCIDYADLIAAKNDDEALRLDHDDPFRDWMTEDTVNPSGWKETTVKSIHLGEQSDPLPLSVPSGPLVRDTSTSCSSNSSHHSQCSFMVDTCCSSSGCGNIEPIPLREVLINDQTTANLDIKLFRRSWLQPRCDDLLGTGNTI